MNENRMIYHTKVVGRVILTCISWLVLIYILSYMIDFAIWIKVLLVLGLLIAMILSIYNGYENHYTEFKQPLKDLNKLDEGSFTYLLERLYRTLGYYTKIQGNVSQPNTIKLIKEQQVILMQCYNKKSIDFEAVQQLVGWISRDKTITKGILVSPMSMTDEKVLQLARLNHITIVDGVHLEAQMLAASKMLEGCLDGAISAFWCHPFKWVREHFLEAEPRFMYQAAWLEWTKLTLKNLSYQTDEVKEPEVYGAQIIAQKEGVKIVIKCIGKKNQVMPKHLDALKASIPFFEVDHAMIVTNSHVTHKIRKLAKCYGITVLNFDQTLKWVKKQNMNEKAVDETK
ncbi:restriction endonuclease [Cellulosilyticum ruminicola]|uniref:restriction endonuclease n=1 Tax=Cellulosilyticum ruminicola TaxID=425254 RepID=UPI0006CF88FA|nr:restriction endonuclease [Cellulosilyticum ruminicola]